MRIATILLLFFSSNAFAFENNFDAYCSRNGDLTTTCIGWEGQRELTCVSSLGDTLSCETDTGSKFVCIDNIGATSCIQTNKENRNTFTQCVLEYGNTASCRQEVKMPNSELTPSIDLQEDHIDELFSPSAGSPNTVF